MSLLRFFHATAVNEEDREREKAFLASIKKSVSEKCGCDDFIDYDEYSVAFAGSKDDMQLLLEICTQKSRGKKYLYASVDDEVSWQEWDFETSAAFEEAVSAYIANRVNRTVKEVIAVENDVVRCTSYYRNENGEWICFEDDPCKSKLASLLVAKAIQPSEKIVTYKLII